MHATGVAALRKCMTLGRSCPRGRVELQPRLHLHTSRLCTGDVFNSMRHLVQPESVADADRYEKALQTELSRIASKRRSSVEVMLKDEEALAEAAEAVVDRAGREGFATVGMRQGAYGIPTTRDMAGSGLHTQADHAKQSGVEPPK